MTMIVVMLLSAQEYPVSGTNSYIFKKMNIIGKGSRKEVLCEEIKRVYHIISKCIVLNKSTKYRCKMYIFIRK